MSDTIETLAALDDEQLGQRIRNLQASMAELSEVIETIKEQIREERHGVTFRGQVWLAKASKALRYRRRDFSELEHQMSRLRREMKQRTHVALTSTDKETRRQLHGTLWAVAKAVRRDDWPAVENCLERLDQLKPDWESVP